MDENLMLGTEAGALRRGTCCLEGMDGSKLLSRMTEGRLTSPRDGEFALGDRKNAGETPALPRGFGERVLGRIESEFCFGRLSGR
jgi:hypothetical protein